MKKASEQNIWLSRVEKKGGAGGDGGGGGGGGLNVTRLISYVIFIVRSNANVSAWANTTYHITTDSFLRHTFLSFFFFKWRGTLSLWKCSIHLLKKKKKKKKKNNFLLFCWKKIQKKKWSRMNREGCWGGGGWQQVKHAKLHCNTRQVLKRYSLCWLDLDSRRRGPSFLRPWYPTAWSDNGEAKARITSSSITPWMDFTLTARDYNLDNFGIWNRNRTYTVIRILLVNGI